MAALGVPPKPMLPNTLAPKPWLGDEAVAAAFAGVCPNEDPPNRGLIGVVVAVAPWPKTLPADNPVAAPLDCPNTDDDPKDETDGATLV